jgi:hypothetical protein
MLDLLYRDETLLLQCRCLEAAGHRYRRFAAAIMLAAASAIGMNAARVRSCLCGAASAGFVVVPVTDRS